MKSRADVIMAFVEAITALGGRVLPKQVHDDPWQVDVPTRHQKTAERLLQQLVEDLERCRPS